MDNNTQQQMLHGLFSTRRSIRDFTDKAITDEDMHTILCLAGMSPSSGNSQPWCVHVVGRDTITQLSATIRAHINSYGFAKRGDYTYYPEKLPPSFQQRITRSGQDLHEALSIGRRDVAHMRQQKLRNFDFFGASTGLILTLDKDLAYGSWLDLGICMGHLILAAKSMDIDSCVQGSFSDYGDCVRQVLDIDESQLIVCGIALGTARTDSAINALPRRRIETNQWVRYHS